MDLVHVPSAQVKRLTLTSRAFYNDALGEYEKYICTLLGYDRVLPMNTGVEAWETGTKLARRWGYDVKKIPENQAKMIYCENSFHGRSIAAVSTSTDPDRSVVCNMSVLRRRDEMNGSDPCL